MKENLNWVDLPNDDLRIIFGYDSNQVQTINELNQSYQVLEKTDPDLLQSRLDRLEDIIEFLDDWINNNLSSQDKVKHIKILREISICKRNYLLELINIQLNRTDLEQDLLDYHNTPESKIGNLEIVNLNRLRMYSIKKREYWGDFWYVTLDPCNRQLTNYLRVWEKSKAEKEDIFDFFMWLEGQEVPVNQPYENYLSSAEREQYKITVKNGLLFHGNEVANFDNVKYIYVIDTNLELYIAKETSDMYHSCFCKGKPVVSAGKIVISAGKITAVSFESGHYIPSIKVGYQLFSILKNKGAKLDTDILVSFFFDRNKYTATVTPECVESFSIFESSLMAILNVENKCCV